MRAVPRLHWIMSGRHECVVVYRHAEQIITQHKTNLESKVQKGVEILTIRRLDSEWITVETCPPSLQTGMDCGQLLIDMKNNP